MGSFFEDKSGSVITIDSSGPVRHMLSDVIKEVGFTSVQGLPSVKDALNMIEVERVHWILTSVFFDEPVNVFHLLKIITEHPSLKDIRVTIFIEEEEKVHIPTLSELGAFSYIMKPFNRPSLVEAIQGQLTSLENNNWDTTLVAADQLLTYLKEKEAHQAKFDLTRNLNRLYPANVEYLIDMAEAQFGLGRQSESKVTLKQAKFMSPDLSEKIDEISQKLFEETFEIDMTTEGGFDVLNIGECIITDPDDASRKAVVEILTSLGVKDIKEFEDGEAAWSWIVNLKEPPGLVCHEWRIPKINAPVLAQRIREKFPLVPLFVISSLIKDSDLPLLEEMGISQGVSKPVDKKLLLSKLIDFLQRFRQPKDIESKEKKIRHCINADRIDEAKKLWEEFIQIDSLPIEKRNRVEAELSYANGDYQKCCDLAIESLKVDKNSLFLLNLLGKALIQVGDYESSLKCLERAQQLSPMNITRLCMIAETNLNMGNVEGAEEALDKAKSIDSENEKVKETETSVAIEKNDLDAAKKVMSELHSINSFIGFMNNKAVALAKSEKFDESIALYRKVIDAIPDQQLNLKAVVSYNLGLGLAKNGDNELASKTLEETMAFGKTKVHSKAQSLRNKIEMSVRTGKPLKFARAEKANDSADKGDQKDTANTPTETNNRSLVATVQTNPGDLCCFLVFNNPEPKDNKVKEMLASLPNFSFRGTIERDATFGADKSLRN